MESQTLGHSVAETVKALDNKQALNEVSSEIDIRNARAIGLHVLTNEPSVSAGTIVLETAPVSGYGGTWKTVLTITDLSGGPKVESKCAYEDDDGLPSRVARVRITGTVANGTVDVYVTTHK